MLTLSTKTSSQKLFASDCVTLYNPSIKSFQYEPPLFSLIFIELFAVCQSLFLCPSLSMTKSFSLSPFACVSHNPFTVSVSLSLYFSHSVNYSLSIYLSLSPFASVSLNPFIASLSLFLSLHLSLTF